MLSIGNGFFGHTDYFDRDGRRVGESSFADSSESDSEPLGPSERQVPNLNRRKGNTAQIEGVRCLYCGQGPNSARCQNVTQ
jgi:hypothetical protein